jgi:hypothetical protein
MCPHVCVSVCVCVCVCVCVSVCVWDWIQGLVESMCSPAGAAPPALCCMCIDVQALHHTEMSHSVHLAYEETKAQRG